MPRNEDELELKEGDVVDIMEKCDDGWFVGKTLNYIFIRLLVTTQGAFLVMFIYLPLAGAILQPKHTVNTVMDQTALGCLERKIYIGFIQKYFLTL